MARNVARLVAFGCISSNIFPMTTFAEPECAVPACKSTLEMFKRSQLAMKKAESRSIVSYLIVPKFLLTVCVF